MLFVDSVFGNDATALRQSQRSPFKTITAALIAATPGDQVHLYPGTYTESIVIPDNIAVRGESTGSVIIERAGVIAATDLVTMGENARLEDVSLRLLSSQHVRLRGIVFPGTTSATSKLRVATLLVDNSAAGAAGTSDVYGLHSDGTGMPAEGVDAARACTITIRSIGLGNKRGVLVDTASSFSTRDVNYVVANPSGGAGSYIGGEVNHAAGQLFMRTGLSDGASSDVSRTLGALTLGSMSLPHSTSNGKGFSTILQLPFGVWADPGSLPGGTIRFMRPGTEAVTATEIKLRLPQKAVVKGLTVKSIQPPGAGNTDIFTVRKNGVDTLLVAALTNLNDTVQNLIDAVTFAASDDLSIKVTTAPGTGTTDVVVTVEIY